MDCITAPCMPSLWRYFRNVSYDSRWDDDDDDDELYYSLNCLIARHTCFANRAYEVPERWSCTALQQKAWVQAMEREAHVQLPSPRLRFGRLDPCVIWKVGKRSIFPKSTLACLGEYVLISHEIADKCFERIVNRPKSIFPGQKHEL